MTDPVDTDALRALSAWLYVESQFHKSQLAESAADEVDRLRAVIENAPHGSNCVWRALRAQDRYCTCWKVEAHA